MPLRNKNKIAWLGALTLLFSYAEMLLPRFLPFFRLGLGNIAILLALDLSLSSFIILTVIKSLASSLMSGTLFSPFMLISLGQSLASGFVMWILARLNKAARGRLLSLYGISIVGSAASAIVQIFLSSLYLGSGTFALLGSMLFFSLASGIVTAFFSQILHIPEDAPVLERIKTPGRRQPVLLISLLILAAAAIIFMLQSIYLLVGILIVCLSAQALCHRRIYILPHISLWAFVILSSLFVPNGKVLFQISSFSITDGALLDGVIKSVKLSAVSALSQCAASLRPEGDGLLALVLAYFRALSNLFWTSEGNFIQKLKICLQSDNLRE